MLKTAYRIVLCSMFMHLRLIHFLFIYADHLRANPVINTVLHMLFDTEVGATLMK